MRSEAFSLIKDYDKYTAALNKVKEEKRKGYGNVRTPHDVGSFVDCALSDEPFPQDVISAEEQRERAVRNHTRRQKMLTDAEKELSRLQKVAVQDHSDAPLSYLRKQLDKLVEEVQSVQRVLSTTPDANAILRSDDREQRDAWNRADELISRYDEIRTTQKEIASYALPKGDLHKFFEVGIFRNSLDYSSFWQEKRRRGYTSAAAQDNDEAVRDYNEWLASFTASPYPFKGIWPIEDRKAYLLNICTEKRLWVPTIDELVAAHNAANTAVLPVDRSKLEGSEEARDRYYEITGAEPTTPYTRSKSAGVPAPRRSDRRKAGLNALLNR